MPASYLPLRIAPYSIWVAAFAALLTADPALYGLTAGDAAAVQAAADDFAVKYGISSTLGTRTRVTIADTQASRNALSATIRSYVRLILANAGVLDANKTALGLTIRDVHPTPIPPPATSPVLGLVGATPGQLTLTFRDTGSSLKSRSRPAGVLMLELHMFLGTVAPATPDATPYFADITRSPFAIDIPGADVGKDAFLYGRWKNAKGEVGPWSALLTTGTI
jgi:hypothetical protein